MEIEITQEAKEYLKENGEAIVLYRGKITACCLSRTVGPKNARTPVQVQLIKNIAEENLDNLETFEQGGITIYTQPGLLEEEISGKLVVDSLFFIKKISFEEN
ncbi:MAG: hypothetical protein ACOC1W_03095 [Bacillota bacterium]